MTAHDMFAGPGDDSARDTFSARDAMLDWMQEIAPYGIFTTDRELRIRTWNHWLILHSGVTAENAIGRPLVELFPTVKERRLDEHFRRALGGEVSVLSTALHKYLLPLRPPGFDPDLPHMLQTVRIAPLPAGDLVLGTITIIEDVTQRERQALLLQRQQEFDRVLSAALGVLLQSIDPLRDVAALFPKVTLPLGLEAYFTYLYDPQARVLELNAAGGVLPKHREALATLRLGEAVCGQCAQQRRAIICNYLQDSTDPATALLRRIGFRSYCCFPLLVSGRLLGTLSFASSARETIEPDEIECMSTVAQYVAIAMDRTARENALREAEGALRAHAEMLEVKVAERTARLHDSVAQLESFTYTLAHDLRAPIRALNGYCEILREEHALTVDAHAILGKLQRATRHLDALTRDLLKFSAISRQEVQVAPVDVAELVREIVFLNPALQAGVVAVKEPLAAVTAHRLLLQQCLSNLFDNALKFARPGVPPRILVQTESRALSAPTGGSVPGFAFSPAVAAPPAMPAESTAGEALRVRIWVEDNGLGIPPESHEKIFGIFERVDAMDVSNGTGIGLAIVARAVQRMKGSCGVESVEGRGSRFWMEFAPAPPAPPSGRSSLSV